MIKGSVFCLKTMQAEAQRELLGMSLKKSLNRSESNKAWSTKGGLEKDHRGCLKW